MGADCARQTKEAETWRDFCLLQKMNLVYLSKFLTAKMPQHTRHAASLSTPTVLLTWLPFHIGTLFSQTHPAGEPSIWLDRVTSLRSNYRGFNVLNLRANYIIFTLKCCDKELYNKGEAVMKAEIHAIVH